MTSFSLTLVTYPPTSDEPFEASDYLWRRETGEADWLPPEEAFTFLLVMRGQRYLADDWSFGDVRLLAPQLWAAARRLLEGQTAIVRSGARDGVGAAYLVFEPVGSDEAEVSLFQMQDPEWEFVFPLRPGADVNEELYRYFDDQRGRLLAAPRSSFDPYLLRVPRRRLIRDLERCAALGDRVGGLVPTPPPSF